MTYTLRYHQDKWVVYWANAIWYPCQMYFERKDEAEFCIDTLNANMGVGK